MEGTFQIKEGLGVFWRSAETLQIGLDPRVGVVIEDLTPAEQDLVARLSDPMTAPELDAFARRHRLRPTRVERILSMLERADVLRDGRLAPSSPLSSSCVRIESLDPLGVAIGLTLARSGVGSVVFDDPSPVAASDHPALSRRGAGQRRDRAFLTVLRSAAPGIRTHGEPDAAVVTGSRLIDPRRTYGLCDERTPHLLAWVEEVDACVGPLVEPGAGACAACAYHARCEADGAWANLASQAALARPIGPTPAVRDLASALGARAVMGFLEGAGNTLHDVQWRGAPGGCRRGRRRRTWSRCPPTLRADASATGSTPPTGRESQAAAPRIDVTPRIRGRPPGRPPPTRRASWRPRL